MKKYLFGLFAIALAVTFSAFTSTQKVVDYYYFDVTDDASAFDNPLTWVDMSVAELPSCDGEEIEFCSAKLRASDQVEFDLVNSKVRPLSSVDDPAEQAVLLTLKD